MAQPIPATRRGRKPARSAGSTVMPATICAWIAEPASETTYVGTAATVGPPSLMLLGTAIPMDAICGPITTAKA